MVERLITAEVGGVTYKDITLAELDQKQARFLEREAHNASMRARYPHYVPGKHNVYNVNCAGCGQGFNLTPALCAPCLAHSVANPKDNGPYRTPGMLATPYEGDPELCGGCGGLHPYPFGFGGTGGCPGTLNENQIRTRLSFWADIALMNDNKRLESKLDDERWRNKRLTAIAILFAVATVILGIYAKLR